MRLARIGVAVTLAAAVSVSIHAQGRAGGAAQQQQQNVPTPKTADGHPDLSGMWNGGGGGGGNQVRPDEKGNLVAASIKPLLYNNAVRPVYINAIKGQVWADPDKEQAVHYMQNLLDDRDFGRQMGRRASQDIRSKFSFLSLGLRYRERLDQIHQQVKTNGIQVK